MSAVVYMCNENHCKEGNFAQHVLIESEVIKSASFLTYLKMPFSMLQVTSVINALKKSMTLTHLFFYSNGDRRAENVTAL
jgi:hypothetical protein